MPIRRHLQAGPATKTVSVYKNVKAEYWQEFCEDLRTSENAQKDCVEVSTEDYQFQGTFNIERFGTNTTYLMFKKTFEVPIDPQTGDPLPDPISVEL